MAAKIHSERSMMEKKAVKEGTRLLRGSGGSRSALRKSSAMGVAGKVNGRREIERKERYQTRGKKELRKAQKALPKKANMKEVKERERTRWLASWSTQRRGKNLLNALGENGNERRCWRGTANTRTRPLEGDNGGTKIREEFRKECSNSRSQVGRKAPKSAGRGLREEEGWVKHTVEAEEEKGQREIAAVARTDQRR